MATKFNSMIRLQNEQDPLMKAKYLDIQNSTDKSSITIEDTDLFVIQDGSSTGQANTGKIPASKIRDYIGTSQLTGITLTADDTNSISDSEGDVSFNIVGGTNCSTNVKDSSTIELDVPTATAGSGSGTVGASSYDSGTFTVTSGHVTIANDAISLAQLANAGSVGVLGSTTGSGDFVLGKITADQINDDAVTFAKMQNITEGKILIGASDGAISELASGSLNDVLTINGSGHAVWSAPASSDITINGDDNVNETFSTGNTLNFDGQANGITTDVSKSSDDVTIAFSIDSKIQTNEIDSKGLANQVKKLWDDDTGGITIGNSGAVTANGSWTYTGNVITTNSGDFSVSDQYSQFMTNVGGNNWGGGDDDANGVSAGMIFLTGAFTTSTTNCVDKNDSMKMVANWNGSVMKDASTRATMEFKHPHAVAYSDATNNAQVESGDFAPIASASITLNSSKGASFKALTGGGDNPDGMIIWDGTDLYIYDE